MALIYIKSYNQNYAVKAPELLFGLASVYRYDGGEIDAKLAAKEADILHKALKDNEFTHDEILRVITTRSKAQLLATINRYKDDHGISITKHLRDGTDSDYLSAIRTIIQAITDPHKYYEKVLRRAIKKSGTDEDTLTRIIVTRAEKDLKVINERYHKRNSVSLEQAVAKDTSGDYKAFLLALLGNHD
ncbi:calcium-binding protein [Lithospermum erythrorhizon]|uniref:Annexin n=1 Tax=Lithospermum erythrorhizon TaxID=34254 RepID=A0AAV3RPU0_LITER